MEEAVLAAVVRDQAKLEPLVANVPLGAAVAPALLAESFLTPPHAQASAGQLSSPAPLESPKAVLSLPPRYKDLGLIGQGGMGEVRRVYDQLLGRTLAMKLIRHELLTSRDSLARFIEEAQATAQLQHPGILPVHDLGRLADGRCYFTLKEVTGRTLGSVIAEVHGAVKNGRWEPSPSGWTFRRLMEVFFRVCETVAYAHTRSVLHRDLKPSNVMVGAFGEVLVLDWGLAKVSESMAPHAEGGQERLYTLRSQAGSLDTHTGRIMGTPAYMSPEQAQGQVLGPASDVYGLGAILYELLSGRPPYEGAHALAVVQKILLGSPQPPGRGAGPAHGDDTASSINLDHGQPLLPPLPSSPSIPQGEAVPAELRALCESAMSRSPADRPANAGELARAVEAWLTGDQRRTEALQLVAHADAMEPELQSLHENAGVSRMEAQALRQGIASHEPVERKLPAWRKEEHAEELAQQHDLRVLRYMQTLRSALNHEPNLLEAHERLARYYRAEHTAAEQARDARAAARLEVLLRMHDLSGQSAAYLKGDGTVTLWTDPDGAEVELHRYTVQNRRLVLELVRKLGCTPLTRVPLPMGSYLLVIRAEGRIPVRYPVHITRQAHWEGIRPGGCDPLPVYLPLPEQLGPDDLYVPAGWFSTGGDPAASGSPLPRQRVWVDGFILRRAHVTNAEYVAFLDDLVAQGREEEALRWLPRERATRPDEPGAPLYGRDHQGRFQLLVDAEGDNWMPDWPVIMVDWHAANAYARWQALRTGMPWRIPGELEWEKAARGVDGRFHPWGDYLDPTWCNMRESRAGLPHLAPVGASPIDESPYLARDMAGNLSDWCLDTFRREGPELHEGIYTPGPTSPAPLGCTVRGGNWYMDVPLLRLASRAETQPTTRDWGIGFRLARPAPDSTRS